jgi:hypothetical protein
MSSIALVVFGFGLPIVLTWLGYLPYISTMIAKVRPYIVYPSLIGTYQVRPLPYFLGNGATVGQAGYIALFLVLNVLLSAASYESKQPHAWYPTVHNEIISYIFYRTGYFAFALLPLTILFSSRNNFLLWATNWSHSTFLLLHRWVGRVCALHALLHTLLALPNYYPRESTKEYWVWGAVATIALLILVFSSGLYVRSFAYEFFLISHILLTVFVLAGCWYHIALWMPGMSWGYETWLYAACAVWFFDRLVRVGRVLKSGVRRAKVTDLGGGYIRADIEGIRWGSKPGNHAYTYFPTLNPLRPWENHPFSIIPTYLLHPAMAQGAAGETASGSASRHSGDVEKNVVAPAQVTHSQALRTTAGITLYIKKSTGMTKYLQSHESLLTLLDGPYPNNSINEALRCDRLLLIGGGIGITGLLPWTASHPNVKLCWSVKGSAKCLVDDMAAATSRIAQAYIKIGQRLDIGALLTEEIEAGWSKVGVVVSGPGALCDDVRAAVVEAGKIGKTTFDLEIDAYSW